MTSQAVGEHLTYLYTSQAEIERIFSSTAVDLRVDDITAEDTTNGNTDLSDSLWEEILSDATDIINQYVELYYNPIDLYSSRWVRMRATYIGAHIVSYRRGNPSLFRDRYEQILEELTMVKDGSLIIPRLPTRDDFTPAMSNVAVNDKYYIDKIRVHPTISTGGTSGRQSIQPYVPDYQI